METPLIKAVDHIEIVVTDVERTVAFFQLLGFELVRKTEHHGGSAELRIPVPGGTVIEIHRVGAEENPGVNHIAFRCDDVSRAYETLVHRGVAFEDNPTDWGKPFLVAQTNRWVANLRTPDGVRLQLTSDAHAKTPT